MGTTCGNIKNTVPDESTRPQPAGGNVANSSRTDTLADYVAANGLQGGN